jgi:hypothetical protein
MDSALVPSAVAASGGSALMAVIAAREARLDARMRTSRVRLPLRFPIGLEPVRVLAALDGLAGQPYTNEFIFEVAAASGSITHWLWVPAAVRESVTATLAGTIPNLRVGEAQPAPAEGATLSLRLFVPTPVVLGSDHPVEASRTLLAGLAALRPGEQAVVRWAVRPGLPRTRSQSGNKTADEASRAWQRKLLMPGFRVAGLAVIRTAKLSRARELAAHVEAVLRSRRGLAGQLRVTSGRGTRALASMPRTTRTSGWLSAPELLPLAGWPLGAEVVPGVTLGAARQIPPADSLARHGRPLFVAQRGGQPRRVYLDAEGSARHVVITGSSGGGKSTFLGAGIVANVAAGYGGFLLDPKGDLVATVLDHLPPEAASRIAVIDPSAEVVPGIDLFAGGDPDLRADALVTTLRSLFRDSWGPRLDSYLRLGLRTLGGQLHATLTDLPALFLDARVRRAAVARLDDPLLVGRWRAFEALGTAERMQHLQAPLSRILSLISRPPVRMVFGPKPTLDVAGLLARRHWIMVPLASGTIGAPAARIIGSALTSVVWAAIAARAAVPPAQRHLVNLYFDELQVLADQGVGLEDLLEQARGYGASVTVATQAIGRIPEQLRHSLLSNASTLICLRAGAAEARRLAPELPGLQPQDLVSLAPFEVAARVATGQGSGSVVVTGHTEPLGKPAGEGAHIRALSAQRWGRSRQEVEDAIRARYGTDPAGAPDGGDGVALGRARRPQ